MNPNAPRPSAAAFAVAALVGAGALLARVDARAILSAYNELFLVAHVGPTLAVLLLLDGLAIALTTFHPRAPGDWTRWALAPACLPIGAFFCQGPEVRNLLFYCLAGAVMGFLVALALVISFVRDGEEVVTLGVALICGFFGIFATAGLLGYLTESEHPAARAIGFVFEQWPLESLAAGGAVGMLGPFLLSRQLNHFTTIYLGAVPGFIAGAGAALAARALQAMSEFG